MIGVGLGSQTDVAGWRAAARRLRLAGVAPEAVQWNVGSGDGLLDADPLPPASAGEGFTAPAEFLRLAGDALLHRSEARFDLMYRILWRLKDEPHLLKIVTDSDVNAAMRLQKAV